MAYGTSCNVLESPHVSLANTNEGTHFKAIYFEVLYLCSLHKLTGERSKTACNFHQNNLHCKQVKVKIMLESYLRVVHFLWSVYKGCFTCTKQCCGVATLESEGFRNHASFSRPRNGMEMECRQRWDEWNGNGSGYLLPGIELEWNGLGSYSSFVDYHLGPTGWWRNFLPHVMWLLKQHHCDQGDWQLDCHTSLGSFGDENGAPLVKQLKLNSCGETRCRSRRRETWQSGCCNHARLLLWRLRCRRDQFN